MKNRIIYLLLLILSAFNLFAQDYWKTRKDLQEYYDSLLNIKGVENMKGTGYTQFNRWKDFWDVRLSPTKTHAQYRGDLLNYVSNYSNPNNVVSWNPIGPMKMPDGIQKYGKGMGQIHFILFDPNNSMNMFACSPVGGLFKSSDGGESWLNAGTDKGLPRSGVSSIAIDPDFLNTRWLITTGNGENFNDRIVWQEAIGVYRTMDGGQNWTNIGLNDVLVMRKIIKIPEIVGQTQGNFIVATEKGLYHTTNAYLANPTWNQLVAGEFYDVEILFNSQTFSVFASGSGNLSIYKLTPNGNGFSVTAIQDPSFPQHLKRRITISVSQSCPDYLFVGVIIPEGNNATDGRLYSFNNITNSWINKGYFGVCDYGGSLDPTRGMGWNVAPILNGNSELVIVGGNTAPLYFGNNLLDNNPINWINKTGSYYSSVIHVDFHYVTFSPDGSSVWIGTDGGIYKGSGTDFSNWEEKNHGLQVSTIHHISVNELIAGEYLSGQYDCGSNKYVGQDQDVIVSHINGGDGFQCVFDPKSIGTYYVSSQDGGILKFYNHGLNSKSIGVTTGLWHTYYTVNPIRTNSIVATGMNGIKWSPNQGDNWYDLEFLPNESNKLTWRISISEVDTNRIFVTWLGNQTGPQIIFMSTFSGQFINDVPVYNWAEVVGLTENAWIAAVCADDQDVELLWAGVGEKVFKVDLSTVPPTWNNISANSLLKGNVNCIEKRKGSSLIYVGTDYGVYQYDSYHNLWENITSNIPNVAVTDIKINRKTGRISVGTFGRGVWEGALPCIDGQQTILCDASTGNLSWDKDKYIGGDIHISDGYTLTITNDAVISMGENTKITVMKGGKLVVDNAMITSGCNGMWQGIELHGDYADPQTYANKGVVELKNGAVIENARIGVSTLPLPASCFVSCVGTGGIIKAENSTFRNCEYALQMHPYINRFPSGNPKWEMSWFKYCTFETTAQLAEPGLFPKAFVDLQGVHKLNFTKCTFKNTLPTDPDNLLKRGYGITSLNSTFFVQPVCTTQYYPCGGYEPSRFENLYCGVHANDAYTNSTFTVNNAVFENNIRGIEANGINGMTITSNQFTIPYLDVPGPVYPAGVFMSGCKTGYKVENNNFTAIQLFDDAQVSVGYNAGIVVDNSGANNNFVYRNTFSNTREAIMAQRQNREANDPEIGLQFRCNEFDHHKHGISVTETDVNEGIAYFQGHFINIPGVAVTNQLTNNLFKDVQNSATSEIHNQGTHIWYMYHLDQPYPPTANGSYVSSGVTLDESQIPWSLSYCPSTLSGSTLNDLSNLYAANKAKANACREVIVMLVDGGDSDHMLWNIESSDPGEAYDLMLSLLEESPYLSQEVLVSVAQNEAVLTPAMVTQILTANPQSARMQAVWDALYDRTNQLPQYMLNAISNNINVSSTKEVLENELSYYLSQKQWSFNEICRIYLNNTDEELEDELLLVYESDTSFVADMLMVAEFIRRGELTEAASRLSDMPERYSLGEYQEADYYQLVEYLNFWFEVISGSLNMNELSAGDEEWLRTTASELRHPMAMNAIALVDFLDNTNYHGSIVFPSEQSPRLAKKPQMEGKTSSLLKVFPNPAEQYFTIEYSITETPGKSTFIEIHSMDGRLIQQIALSKQQYQLLIDTRQMAKGMYICSLKQNGLVIQTSKVNVVKR